MSSETPRKPTSDERVELCELLRSLVEYAFYIATDEDIPNDYLETAPVTSCTHIEQLAEFFDTELQASIVRLLENLLTHTLNGDQHRIKASVIELLACFMKNKSFAFDIEVTLSFAEEHE